MYKHEQLQSLGDLLTSLARLSILTIRFCQVSTTILSHIFSSANCLEKLRCSHFFLDKYQELEDTDTTIEPPVALAPDTMRYLEIENCAYEAISMCGFAPGQLHSFHLAWSYPRLLESFYPFVENVKDSLSSLEIMECGDCSEGQ